MYEFFEGNNFSKRFGKKSYKIDQNKLTEGNVSSSWLDKFAVFFLPGKFYKS